MRHGRIHPRIPSIIILISRQYNNTSVKYALKDEKNVFYPNTTLSALVADSTYKVSSYPEKRDLSFFCGLIQYRMTQRDVTFPSVRNSMRY